MLTHLRTYIQIDYPSHRISYKLIENIRLQMKVYFINKTYKKIKKKIKHMCD